MRTVPLRATIDTEVHAAVRAPSQFAAVYSDEWTVSVNGPSEAEFYFNSELMPTQLRLYDEETRYTASVDQGFAKLQRREDETWQDIGNQDTIKDGDVLRVWFSQQVAYAPGSAAFFEVRLTDDEYGNEGAHHRLCAITLLIDDESAVEVDIEEGGDLGTIFQKANRELHEGEASLGDPIKVSRVEGSGNIPVSYLAVISSYGRNLRANFHEGALLARKDSGTGDSTRIVQNSFAGTIPPNGEYIRLIGPPGILPGEIVYVIAIVGDKKVSGAVIGDSVVIRATMVDFSGQITGPHTDLTAIVRPSLDREEVLYHIDSAFISPEGEFELVGDIKAYIGDTVSLQLYNRDGDMVAMVPEITVEED